MLQLLKDMAETVSRFTVEYREVEVFGDYAWVHQIGFTTSHEGQVARYK